MNITEDNKLQDMAVISDPSKFDQFSGNFLERLVFNNRIWMIIGCSLLTVFFLYQMTHLVVNASYEKMLPQSHPYIKNYLENKHGLRGLSDTVRVVIESKKGNIYNKEYLDVLAKVNDEIFLLPGVDRPWMKSLFTPTVRWVAVTEEGFKGAPVLPENYDGSPPMIEKLRSSVQRADIWGSLVSNDYKSSMIVVPLMDKDADGHVTDYRALSESLEQIRAKYAGAPDSPVRIYIIGFAKLIGDLIDGLQKVMLFFLAAAVVAAVIIFLYTRCLRSTALVLLCSLVAVIWQLGLVVVLGGVLDPYSILVPFLVFAIGVSHGAQKMNGIMQDIGRGTHKWVAARYTFRRLFIAGLTALLADAVGFAVLMVIDIPVIRDLAMTASMGVAVLIFTNLLLLPVLLSYVGVSPVAAKHSLKEEEIESRGRGFGKIWGLLGHFTQRKWAATAIVVSLVIAAGGYGVSLGLKVGDLDPGAPELRPDSRYNLDNAFITSNYRTSSDLFVVMVKTPLEQCGKFDNLVETDRLAWELRQLPSVQQTSSLPDLMRSYLSGFFEGSTKWDTLSDTEVLMDGQVASAVTYNSELLNPDCWLLPVIAYLTDHKAETLKSVVRTAEGFAKEHDTDNRKFLLAAGSAGIEAATNIVVEQSNRTMLLYVYSAVILLCAIAFRSWRAIVVAVVPLAMTSILAEALMVKLGIGVKVATLPVIALGVGIGVDYALYLLSVQLAGQRRGLSLEDAFRNAVAFTGKVVGLVGVTLAAGVVTWAWSPIKFQADMGILLTFMFLWNMLGALILIPALSHFLLSDKYFAKLRVASPNTVKTEAN